ncbi:hypothetical protein HU200_035055 [Digitaria exilis]|uniref:Uncharacterized protein n=1 Tax=Digitaria exilis TaxID=1010633 RepID=A0A835ENE6_9POAL|nr:hypothetical protein HU200_035055 [Digitaria exilis]
MATTVAPVNLGHFTDRRIYLRSSPARGGGALSIRLLLHSPAHPSRPGVAARWMASAATTVVASVVEETETETTVPREQVEAIRSLNGWVEENMLPLLTPVDALPWARWLRGWTAEENRHGDLLNRYLYLTGRVDMRQVEVTIHHLLRNGMVRTYVEMLVPKSPYHSLIYGAFQERATFISHGHTARLAARHGDGTLARICGVIAADERRHEAGYTMASAKLFDVDPDGMVRALAHVMRGKVTMPGLLMSDGHGDGGSDLFGRFSAVAQRAGVYTASDYGDLVEHFVRRWRVADLDAGLSGEGRRAQEYVCALAPKIRRMEELAQRRAARGEPGMARFSWIFDRPVVLG